MAVRVLLVDDVDDIRRLVRTALRFRGGFEVVGEAADGAEAVRMTRNLQPDIVVLDLGLPDLAGREVLGRLRLHAPGTRVVVFSGAESQDRSWMTHHVEGYVLKDAQLDYLVDLLETVGQLRGADAAIDLAQALSSVREARRFVHKRIAEWGLEPLLDDALLIVSELTTNAITHAHSPCGLRLVRTPTTLRIEVVDEGAGSPEPQPPSTTEESGRGVHLVAALTSAWGIEVVEGEGKLVWAELPIPEGSGQTTR
jgi:DNA-binding NarL/FixJ family response regulator